MNKTLEESKKEFDFYKNNANINRLQKASNLLFKVVEDWLMKKHKEKVNSYKELKKAIKNNKDDLSFLIRASRLHNFSKNNIIVEDIDDIEYEYLDIYQIMKSK